MITLNDIISYIETQAATISDLAGKIRVTLPGQPIPDIKDYGLRISFTREDWKEIVRNKIGPIVTEIYRIDVDLVFNRAKTPRAVFSDAKGISYWENTLMDLFVNQHNNHTFKDSFWSPVGAMEMNPDSTILKGVLTVTLQNIY